MGKPYPPVEVKVWGDYACFTDPAQKVERVSYPVMTPSAARGVLEAIFWHKPMQWRIREIQVLKPIRRFSILRNEVNAKMSPSNRGLVITEQRAQRHTLGLRDVAYIIRADIHLPRGNEDIDPAKYRDQFRRRVGRHGEHGEQRGSCFQRPYLGCREFAADFSSPDGSERPIHETFDLGLMLFDIRYSPKQNVPIFFPARLEQGVLHVPEVLYEGSNA